MRSLAVPTLLVGIATLASAYSPPVKVSLRTSWNSTTLLTEILETVALEEPRSFFPLLDLLTDPATFELPLITESSQGLYTKFLDAISKRQYLKEPGSFASFERALALHAASPKIEAFHSFYAQNRDLNSFQERHDAVHCPTWVDWYGQRICSPEELVAALGYECPNWLSWHGHQVCAVDEFTPIKGHKQNIPKANAPKLLSFDHINPPPSDSLTRPPATAILYASLDSASFYSLHHILYRLSNKSPAPVQYVLRHVPLPAALLPAPSYLSGYGVALDLKKMEYLALDDRRKQGGTQAHLDTGSDQETESSDPILSLLPQPEEDVIIGSLNTIKLSEKEIQELGVKASQVILKSPNPLSALERLSQNFPFYANSLSRRLTQASEKWDQNVADTIHANQQMITPGQSVMWLNGNLLQKEDLNPFALLRILRKERKTVLGLTNLGLKVPEAVKLLTSSNKVQRASSAAIEGLFDASDRPEGGELIAWLNDLEKDERYARWSPTLHALFQHSFQLPSIKRNIFNVVCALDLTQQSSWTIIGTFSNIITRTFPMHIGVIPIAETEEGIKVARLFYYLMENYDLTKTLNTFSKGANPSQKTVDFTILRAVFNELVTYTPPTGDDITTDFDFIISSAFDDRLERLPKYHSRLATRLEDSPTGHGFINGRYFAVDDSFLQNVQNTMNQHVRYLQEELYYGNIHDAEKQDMATYFYNLPSTFKSRNPYILPGRGGLKVYSVPDLASRNGIPETSRFIYPEGDTKTPLSIWIVGDFDSPGAVSLFREALLGMESDKCQYRLAFIHAPNHSHPSEPFTSAALYTLAHGNAIEATSPNDLLKLLKILHPAPTTPEDRNAANQLLDELLGEGAAETLSYSVEFKEAVKGNQLFAKQINLKPGATAIFVNGRVVGPIKEGDFKAADFEALSAYELNQRVDTIREVLEDIHFDESVDRASHAHIVAMASSIISADQVPDPTQEGLFDKTTAPRSRPYQHLQAEHASFEVGNNQTALFHFGLLLDPLSETAQTWSSLLRWLEPTELVHIVVYMNPGVNTGTTELPVKRFFRYNLQTKLEFDEEDFGTLIKPEVEFQNLPEDPIYTLAMDLPQSWLARPRESQHDLDNIHLASLSGNERSEGVNAIFSLDYLVVEGHARDAAHRTPVRGLQLQLLANNTTPVADTLVVDNLGYLQFKATPGIFQLEIRPGRGSEIFELESAGSEGWYSPTVEEIGTDISVTNFEGVTIYPRFQRRSGMEKEDVLDVSSSSGGFSGFVNKVGSFFSKSSVAEVKPQAEINIFTVASGMLYERFASIMILSVLKNTKSTVKFWFIENFLSPSFLEFLPHFAEAHNFEYELVTYKWPSWLRMPTEKQRIIWGYKILFLDVLFPMDLKKVIFVDADQIVRADLKELVDLDLNGAPYGYTPMGDDSHDMDGFRFWKTGYWKDHLKGRPYHISALYVVDLVRFRQLAAGDKLRGQYQALSADPNSLSNLDQDLPNNLQKEVPIFSLPEDWLWCETWCSKDRLHRAKTIDLCQNPQTKEPKLSRARQIPEWEEYDRQIATFARKLAESGKITSTAVAEDVNALAGDKKAQPTEKAPTDKAQVVFEAHQQETDATNSEAGGLRDEL